MDKANNKFEKTINYIQVVLQSLQRETNIFIDASKKFKSKLPRDHFMSSCADVLRQLKFLFNMNELEMIKDSKNIVISDSFVELSVKIAKQSYNINESCLKAFSLSEQRMRLGFFVVAYTLALGILARIYSLSKALILLAARLSYDLKQKLCFVSNSKQPNVELRNFGWHLLASIGYSPNKLYLLTRSDSSVEDEYLDEIQDLGVVISRDEGTNLIPEESLVEETNDKVEELPEILNEPVPFNNIKNLKHLKEVCRKTIKSGGDRQELKAQVKVVFTQTVKKVKKLKAKGGKNVKSKKKLVQMAASKMTDLLKSSLKETAAKSKGYQSIFDDEIEESQAADSDIDTNVTPKQTTQLESKVQIEGLQNWKEKKTFLKKMKSSESVKEMLSMWKQMMKGQREDLNELIPSSVSKKDRIQIRKLLARTSKVAGTVIKPQLQVRKTARKVVSLIEEAAAK